MNAKALILAVALVGVLLVGCESKTSGYATYSQNNQPQQGQYVGGGCGVAPSGDYESTPINGIENSKASVTEL